MKTIALFGAGKSATVLIEYLIAEAPANKWKIIVADASLELILSKTNHAPFTEPVQADIRDAVQRASIIQQADVVISMMPPALHILIAKDCLQHSKHLLTASYVDESIAALKDEIKNKGLLFLCEMGLDPGIDHMSAMQMIDVIHENGGKVTSFKSHCGGLVAPESDDNPWRYKISWNPRNIVLAGKAGAVYKLNGHIVKEEYKELFEPERGVKLNDETGFLSWYPNRDSLGYIDTYGLQSAETFIRTTLRYPDFMYGWNNVVELQLTDETAEYDTDGMTVAAFFKTHFDKVGFGEWLNNKLSERLDFAQKLGESLQKLSEVTGEQEAAAKDDAGFEMLKKFSIVNESGDIETIDVEATKDRAAHAIAHKMHEANLTLKQLFFLGMDDDITFINKGKCSAADVLQFILEKKLALQPLDKDMIVMLHEIEYEQAGEIKKCKSSLVVKGEDSLRTAMAKTVGLPLGIAAKLILNGGIQLTGLHIPTAKEIYMPVLEELKKQEIVFIETMH